MSSVLPTRYEPDFVFPPGETLVEALESLGMTQADLAERTGRPRKTINEIVKGKIAITPDTALQLERVLGIPARFWMNYEQLYRGALAKQAEERRLRRHLAWLQQFPLHAMARRGWIQPCEDGVQQIRELLNFFGIASPERWYETWSSPEVAYRRSRAFRSTPGALSAWLRAGELEGQQIRTAAYSGARFRDVLAQVRRMTVQHQREVFDNVARICSEAGVAVAFIKEVKGAPVSGATRWVTPDKALILLTIRYKTDDQLWFSFFHEAGHVLLHGKREVFIEEDGNDDPRELQANSFARDVLIPPTAFRRLVSMAKKPSRNMVVSFASQTGIAPGIVVGRLQHEGLLPFSHLNDLKHRLRWSEE